MTMTDQADNHRRPPPSSTGRSGRCDRRLLAVLALAFFLRATAALAPGIGGNRLRLPDSFTYHYAARSLLERGRLFFGEVQRAKREPGYPLFVAGCYAPFYLLSRPPAPLEAADRPSVAAHLPEGPPAGYRWPPPAAVRLVQALVGALLCLPVYGLAGRLGGRRAARWAALSVALYPALVGVSALVITECLYTTLLWTALWAVSMPGRSRSGGGRLGAAVGAAAAWGALTAVRNEALVLFPAVALATLVVSPARGAAARQLAAALVGLALVSGAWAWRNQRILGRPILTTLNLGETLYDGLRPGADGRSDKQAFMPGFLSSGRWRALDEVGRDRWLRSMALDYARRHPGRLLRLAWRKAVLTWGPFPRGGLVRGAAGRVVGAAYCLALLAGLVGCWRRRKRWREWVLWLVPVAVIAAIHLVVVGSVRYRIPAMPFFLVMGTLGLAGRGRPKDD